MSIVITTPRPPLNLYEVVREVVDSTPGGTTLYEVPEYLIPANGPVPARTQYAAAIITSAIAANVGPSSVILQVRVVEPDSSTFTLLPAVEVPADGYSVLDIGQQIFRSGDRIVAETVSGAVDVSVSFVLNTRELFEVLP